MSTNPDYDPLVISVAVPLEPEQAFRLFTAGIDQWWPSGSHSVTGEGSRPTFETRIGGRIYEVGADGTEHTWGTIESIEPPDRVAFTWHPGREPETAQLVEVVFVSRGEETVLTLTQTGWAALGNRAAETRRGYETGWKIVLAERFADSAKARH